MKKTPVVILLVFLGGLSFFAIPAVVAQGPAVEQPELRPAAATDANGLSAETVADLWVIIDGATYGPFRDEAYSAVRNAQGEPVEVTADVQYRAKLKIGPKTESWFWSKPLESSKPLFIRFCRQRRPSSADGTPEIDKTDNM